ncbi:hypothetical protein ABIA15_005696 [Sinorhizobium fredii]
MFGCDCPGRRRPHVGQVAIVDEQRLNQPRAARQQYHHAIGARQADLRIVEEAGADLDREAVEARHIGGLDVDLAAMLGNIEPQDRRHRHRPGGECVEGILDAGNRLAIKRHDAAQLRLGENRHPCHAASSRNGSVSPFITRRCRPMSTLRPETMTTIGPPVILILPARSAAMPTAPAPSTTSRSCV